MELRVIVRSVPADSKVTQLPAVEKRNKNQNDTASKMSGHSDFQRKSNSFIMWECIYHPNWHEQKCSNTRFYLSLSLYQSSIWSTHSYCSHFKATHFLLIEISSESNLLCIYNHGANGVCSLHICVLFFDVVTIAEPIWTLNEWNNKIHIHVTHLYTFWCIHTHGKLSC